MERHRVAVVGCGAIAQAKHIPAFRQQKSVVDISAVCDRDPDIAQKTAKRFRIPGVYTDVQEMLDREDLDIVDICTPPRTHVQIALDSLRKGCHLLLEKPMALSSKECDRMIDASKAANRTICVIHNDLFHPPLVKAMRLVNEGVIGKLVGMRIFLSTPRWDMIDQSQHWYHELPGGVIGETGPHIAYLTQAFIGNVETVLVQPRSSLHLPWAPYDEFLINMEGEKGFCTSLVSYNRNSWSALVDLIGSESMITVDLERLLLIHQDLKKLEYIPIAKSSISGVLQMAHGLTSNILSTVMGRTMVGTEAIIERFVGNISANLPPPVTGEEGRAAVALVERIVKQIDSHSSKKDETSTVTDRQSGS
jgi:predicted dehydrogenase